MLLRSFSELCNLKKKRKKKKNVPSIESFCMNGIRNIIKKIENNML